VESDIDGQRQGRENGLFGLAFQRFALQRPRNSELSREDIAGIVRAETRPVETGLFGWGIEIRTQIYNDEKRPLKRRSNSGGFRNVWGPETFRVPAAK
jgi:hypothetical protein